MPETKEDNVSKESVSIHEIYKEIMAEDEESDTTSKETKEPIKEPEEKEETEEDSPTAEKGQEETEDTEEDENDLDLPELDARAKEAIGDNPKALAEWERAWKGVTKREKQISAKEAALKAVGIDPLSDDGKAELQGFKDLRAGLSNPATAAKTALGIIQFLKDAGITVPGFTPVEVTKPVLEFTEEGYAKGGDKAVFDAAVAQAKAEAKQEVMASLGFDPSEVKTMLENQRQQTQAQAKTKEFDDYVNGVTPRIAAKAKSVLQWEGVDKAMVAEAARELPELIKSDPMLALKKTFPDKWAAVLAKSQNRGKDEKTLIKSGEGGGMEIPKDPMKLTMHHAYALINEE